MDVPPLRNILPTKLPEVGLKSSALVRARARARARAIGL